LTIKAGAFAPAYFHAEQRFPRAVQRE